VRRPYVSSVSERVAPKTPPPPPPEPCVRADALNEQQKRLVWRYIKAHVPEQLAFLQDPFVIAFVERTKAVHVFPKALVDAALGAAKVSKP
jgi:hypothetical protein